LLPQYFYDVNKISLK